MSRGNRSAQPSAHAPHHPAAPHRPQKGGFLAKLARAELFVVIVGSALLIAAVALYMAFGGNLNGEANRIDENKYQAVFLNGGVTSGSVTYSTYFGHIKKMTDKYIILEDVYYLTDAQGENGQSNPQLTKLGCQQLHSPVDEMIINRNQVAFWENLEDRGRVVQAIKQFEQQNPNGPNCEANNQPATSPQNSTAPTTTTPQNNQNQNQNTNQ